MNSRLIFAFGALLFVLLTACGPSANKKLVLDIGGPCESCPVERLDSLLKNVEGYVSHTYDKKSGVLTVDIDSSVTPSRQLAELLTDYGYEVSSKEFNILLPTGKSKESCCTAQAFDIDLDDDDEAMLDDMQDEADDLTNILGDDDLDNLNLDVVSGKAKAKNESLIEEDDLEMEEVSDADFKDKKKK